LGAITPHNITTKGTKGTNMIDKCESELSRLKEQRDATFKQYQDGVAFVQAREKEIIALDGAIVTLQKLVETDQTETPTT